MQERQISASSRLQMGDSATQVETRRRFLMTCAFLAGAPALDGCAIFSGGFHSSNPEAENRAASRAAKDAVKELDECAAVNSDKKLVVCFLGVTGSSGAGRISDTTREILQEGNFRMIEKSAVSAALKESGVRANNVFIPAERKKFVDALGESVDFLMAGYVERVEDEDEDGRSLGKRTVYKLELVNVETNRTSEFTADL